MRLGRHGPSEGDGVSEECKTRGGRDKGFVHVCVQHGQNEL